jgi:hypothetical protein
MHTAAFSYGKRAIFLKAKEIKSLRGGVDDYAVQASVRNDAEIEEKGRFRMKTSIAKQTICAPIFHQRGPHIETAV